MTGLWRGALRRRLLAGVALAASAALLAGCDISLQSLPKYSSLTGPFYDLHATFANVLNLPADAQVRAGVATIGQVSSISAHDFVAEVTLQIEKRVKLPVGTRAEVQFDDPLGTEYVEMLRPSNATRGYLVDGDRLSEADTSTSPSIPDTLAALSTVLNGGGINQLHTIIDQLDAMFNGNQPQLRDLLAKVEGALGSLDAHKGDVDAALAALGNLSSQLNAGAPLIVDGIDALGPAVSVLAGQNRELRQLLASVNRLATVADNVLDATSRDAVNDISELVPVVHQLVGVDRQVGPALASITTFEKLTPRIAPGNSLQVSLVATADLPGSTAATSAAIAGHGRSSAAVTALLEGGLP